MYKLHKLLLISIVLIGICGGNVDASGSISYLGAIESEDSRIKETIYAYFSSRCYAYKSNSPTINFSSIVDTRDSRTTEWLVLEQEIHEIQNLIQTTYPVKILDCRFRLDFQTIEIIDDTAAIVKLSEDYEIIYEHRPTKPSVVANVQHEIWLKRTMDSWVIVEDKYSNDFTRLLKTLSKNSIIENIRKNRDLNREDVLLMDQNIAISTTANTENGMKLYSYNSVAAVTYADSYYNMNTTDGPVPSAITELDGWNSSWDTIYKEYESDCTNFVSQAVFEGVSYTASDPDYFYPDPIHTEEWWYYKFSPAPDGSTPWIRVGDFYELLTENYFNYENFGIEYVIRGPAGKGVNLCNIHIGDVVFMYENEGDPGWVHTVIVDDLDPSHCSGNNVYVAAHSDDAQHRPLSDYSGYLWYPVEIKGYFNYKQIAFLPLILQSTVSTSEIFMDNPYPSPHDLYQQSTYSPQPYPGP